MAGSGQTRNMTAGERLWGGVLLAAYLWALPLAAGPAFALAEGLLGRTLEEGVRDVAYYYVLFSLTLVTFGGYLERNTRYLRGGLWATVRAVCLALAAFLVLNILGGRLLGGALAEANCNDLAIAGKLLESPRSTILIVVFLAPFVEEALFRGYLFGNLREVSRPAAYAVSCLAFGLVHVWQYAAGGEGVPYLLLAVEYVIPGALMAWTYERSGTLWGSVLLHGIVNGLSVARLL